MIEQRVRGLENERDLLWQEVRGLRERMAWQWAAMVDRALLGDVVGQHLGLTGLRGLWPMSSVGPAGNVVDMSGQGRTLTANNTPTFNFDGVVPYVEFDGVSQYLDRADEAALSIVGTESFIASGVRGLTLGGWFRFDAMGTKGILSKWAASDQSYLLDMAGGAPYFSVSSTGADSFSVQGTSMSTATWHFLCGRFRPSTEIAVWVDTDKQVSTTSIPASLYDGTAALEIGRRNADNAYAYDGWAALCFLCAAALSDDVVTHLFSRGRVLFGV